MSESYLTKTFETMKVTVENGVAVVQFDRPEAKNAANVQMSYDRLEIFKGISEDKTVRVVIITGNDEAYCAGGDLAAFSKFGVKEAGEFARRGVEYQKILSQMPQPVIAAVAGYALGGGMENMLMTDLRIAAENAQFGLPEINVGIFPGGGGTQRLIQNLPVAIAKEMIFFGKTISAQEALRWGLVNAVVPLEELMPTAKKWAERLMRKPPMALESAKAAVNNAWNMDITTGMDYETLLWAKLYATEDQKEGMNAFLEKRKPNFRGR